MLQLQTSLTPAQVQHALTGLQRSRCVFLTPLTVLIKGFYWFIHICIIVQAARSQELLGGKSKQVMAAISSRVRCTPSHTHTHTHDEDIVLLSLNVYPGGPLGLQRNEKERSIQVQLAVQLVSVCFILFICSLILLCKTVCVCVWGGLSASQTTVDTTLLFVSTASTELLSSP